MFKFDSELTGKKLNKDFAKPYKISVNNKIDVTGSDGNIQKFRSMENKDSSNAYNIAVNRVDTIGNDKNVPKFKS